MSRTSAATTTTFDAEAFKRQQQDTWDHVSEGWHRWSDLFESGAAVISERLLELADVQPGCAVLDVGTGTGDAAFAAAGRAGPDGRVVGFDISPRMIEIARVRAAGLPQLELLIGDAENPGLESDGFDAVISRWGLMFLPDLHAAIAAVAGLLRPGGRFAASVWSTPPRVPIIALAFGVIAQRLELAPPPPGQPGPFSLADGDALRDALTQAGLVDIACEEATTEFRASSLDELTSFARDVLPPFVKRALRERCGSERDEATWDAVERAAERFVGPDGAVAMPCTAICWSARKPG